METRNHFNPFPGLRPFDPDEDFLFFGRERETDELRRRLRRTRFLAVIGSSGSGKSSLVRSGLIPSLHSGFMAKAGSSWRVAIVHPGGDPIGNLVLGLDSREVLGTKEDIAGTHRAMLEATMRASSLGLAQAICNAMVPEADNVLVVVDQFEELFRFKRSRLIRNSSDEAVAFVKLLLEASQQRKAPVYIVLTMRSEFIGDCMAFPGLPDAINQGQYLIPRMTRDELRAAITGPVAVSGATIAPRLVVRLLNEVGDEPDSLPVIQHSLMRTWHDRHQHCSAGEPIDLRHYEAIGTMKEALSRHADEAFNELKSDRDREIAAKVFKAITDTDQNGRGVRRPASVCEIASICGGPEVELTSVIDRFRIPGRTFLIPPASVPLRTASIIDLSHESLMRLWTRLIAWTKEEAHATAIYRRLSKSAEQHERGEASLWRNPELQIGLRWRRESKPTPAWAERYGEGFQRTVRFLNKSRRAQLLRLLSVAAMVVLVIGVLTWKVYQQREQIGALQRQVSEERSRKMQAEKDVAALRQKSKDLTAHVNQLQKTRGILNEKIVGLRDSNKGLELRIDALNQENRLLVANIEGLKEEYDRFVAKLEDMQDQSDRLTSNVDTLDKENARLDEELRSLRTVNLELWDKAMTLGFFEEASVKEKKARHRPPELSPPPLSVRFFSIPKDILGIDGLRRQVEELQEQLKQLRDERFRLVDEADWLRRENVLLEKQIAALRKENDNLERAREGLVSRNRQLQEIVAEAEQVSLELKKSAVEWQEKKQELQKSIELLQKENAKKADSLDEQLRKMRLLRWRIFMTRRENEGLKKLIETSVDRLIAATGSPQRAPELSALLAVLAYRLAPFDPDDPARPSIYNTLWSALNRFDEKAAQDLISPIGDQTNKLWTTRSHLIVQEICQRVSRGLSEAEWKEFLPADAPYTPESAWPCSDY